MSMCGKTQNMKREKNLEEMVEKDQT